MASKYGGVPEEGQAQPQTSRFGGTPVVETAPVAQPPKVYTEADISPMARQSRAELGDVGEGLNTLREQLQDALLLGGSDELMSAVTGAGQAAMDWYKGGSFDPVKRYNENITRAEGYKAARQARAPFTAAVGDVMGSLGGAGTLAKSGLTVAGRTVPYVPSILQPVAKVGAAAAEGAAVGATRGALSAPPGQRIAGGKQGAVIGGITSGLFQAAGTTASAIDDIFSKRAPIAPAAFDLKAAGQQLYRQAEQEGVRYAPASMQKLGVNIRAAAGRLNERSRPLTMGFVEDAMEKFSGKRSVSFEEMAEFRQDLNAAMRRAIPTDQRTLGQIKNAVDSWANSIQNNAADFTGDAAKAFRLQKAADEIYHRYKKTDVIEKIVDIVDVKGAGKYTQSGVANAAVAEMRSLYQKIQKGTEKGWTKQETELIRQIAKGGSNSKIINTLAKLHPRGWGGLVGGQVVGSALQAAGIPGANLMVPAAGMIAGETADKAALNALEALRSGVASGKPPPLPPVAPLTVIPTAPVALEAERQWRGSGLGGPR